MSFTSSNTTQAINIECFCLRYVGDGKGKMKYGLVHIHSVVAIQAKFFGKNKLY